MNRLVRILAVTFGLCVAGAVMGGIAGATVLTLGLALTTRSVKPLGELVTWWSGGIFGAYVGMVTGPVGAWLLMRRAPIGVAIAYTTIGTVLGGVIGWAIQPILGALIGFVGSALLVRRRYTTRSTPEIPVG